MENLQTRLSDKERAQMSLLEQNTEQYKALLLDILPGLASRELALANTRIEEAYLWAREHVLRSAGKRNGVN